MNATSACSHFAMGSWGGVALLLALGVGGCSSEPPDRAETKRPASIEWLREQALKYSFSPLKIVADLRDSSYQGLDVPPPDDEYDLRQALFCESDGFLAEVSLWGGGESSHVPAPIAQYLSENARLLRRMPADELLRLTANDVRGVWLRAPLDDVTPLDTLPNLQAILIWNDLLNHEHVIDPEEASEWTKDPSKLIRILETDAAKRIIGLQLPAGDATSDKILDHVGKLKQLQALSLWNSDVTDDGMKKLQSLEKLQVLNLDGITLTDAAIEHLAALPELRSLSLNGTKITNACTASFARFPKLMEIRIWKTRIDEEGVIQIKSRARGIKYIQFESD
jgi:hypothetical protein